MKKNNKTKFKGLVNLHLLKYQLYKNLINYDINQISIELKKSLKIIYLYQKKKKKIIFVGFPFNKILHNQLSNNFVSKPSFIKQLQKTKNLSQFDLIVFYQASSKDYNLSKKLNNIGLPIIIFCNNNNGFENKNYIVKNILKNKKIKSFVYFFIFSILIKNLKI